MKSKEKRLIKSLKFHDGDYTPTLVPHPYHKDKFQVTFFYMEDHQDLILSSRAIIHLAMKAIDPEYGINEIEEREEINYIRQALAIANRLLPKGDEALMDHINLFYRQKDKK